MNAYYGPLPPGEIGFEFTTDAVPNGSGYKNGIAQFSLGGRGVFPIGPDRVGIRAIVTRSTID